jgi:hypothetical protein
MQYILCKEQLLVHYTTSDLDECKLFDRKIFTSKTKKYLVVAFSSNLR